MSVIADLQVIGVFDDMAEAQRDALGTLRADKETVNYIPALAGSPGRVFKVVSEHGVHYLLEIKRASGAELVEVFTEGGSTHSDTLRIAHRQNNGLQVHDVYFPDTPNGWDLFRCVAEAAGAAHEVFLLRGLH